jgi:hypothetical protein
VLFADIVDSTRTAAALGDRAWRRLLDEHFGVTRRQLDRFDGRQVKNVGDRVLATFDGLARAVRCAAAIRDGAAELGLELRAGLHTGEIELQPDDIAGLAVHIGARISALAGAGAILVCSTVKDLVVDSGFEFEDRGSPELNGVSGEWRVFALASPLGVRRNPGSALDKLEPRANTAGGNAEAAALAPVDGDVQRLERVACVHSGSGWQDSDGHRQPPAKDGSTGRSSTRAKGRLRDGRSADRRARRSDALGHDP